MLNKIIKIYLLAVFVFLYACTDKVISPQDEIRLYIEKGIEAAENRSAGDLSELVHINYQDERGQNKKQLIKLLRGYFFMHKNIHLFSKIEAITLHSKDEATVVLYIAMAGSVISDASVLSSLRAKMYKFEFDLIKQEEWLLQKASWRSASPADLQ